MNRKYFAVFVFLLSACAGPTPPAQTADNAEPTPTTGPTLPDALGKATCASPTLDDLEDGDGRSIVTDDRGGYWYTYKDNGGSTVEPQGSFSPTEGGANGSKFAAHMQGRTADAGIVYVGLGFNLTDPMAPYDLSTAKGFCFQGKGKGPLRVKLPDVYTAPEGEQCKQCYNDFGIELTLSEEWQEYCFDFAQLKQQSGWGEPKPALTTGRVFSIQWQISANATEFDVFIDDVRLVCGAQ